MSVEVEKNGLRVVLRFGDVSPAVIDGAFGRWCEIVSGMDGVGGSFYNGLRDIVGRYRSQASWQSRCTSDFAAVEFVRQGGGQSFVQSSQDAQCDEHARVCASDGDNSSLGLDEGQLGARVDPGCVKLEEQESSKVFGSTGVLGCASRNQVWRSERKERKKRRQALSCDWRKREIPVKQGESSGFWNSCSDDIRQKLIDSKARMHIAENLRKERDAKDKLSYMDSPEAAMRKAIGFIEYAEKQAKKEDDSKVYSWAKTVATSSAESLARSVPDSVPSFDELSAKLEASSQSSFELELKAKQDELDLVKKECEALKASVKTEINKGSGVVQVSGKSSVDKEKYEAVLKRMRILELEKKNGVFGFGQNDDVRDFERNSVRLHKKHFANY